MFQRFRVFLLIGFCAATAGCIRSASPELYLLDREVEAPTLDAVTVCLGGNCGTRRRVELTAEDWRDIRARFSPPPVHAADERQRLLVAIAALEARVARKVGAERLVADYKPDAPAYVNYNSCIDDTTNTTAFLMLFQQARLMRWNVVVGPAYRGYLVDGLAPHFTAVVRDRTDGREYAIDTWYNPKGLIGHLMPLAQWQNG